MKIILTQNSETSSESNIRGHELFCDRPQEKEVRIKDLWEVNIF